MANNYVYFIRNPKTKEIKIGRTKDPKSRIAKLSSGEHCKLELLGLVEAPDLEKELHARFGNIRNRGEWFQDTRELRRFIKTFRHVPIEQVPPISWGVRAMCLLSSMLFVISGTGYAVQWIPRFPHLIFAQYALLAICVTGSVAMFILYDEK